MERCAAACVLAGVWEIRRMANPTEIKTPSDFLRVLAESRILSEEQMLLARQVESEASSPKTLARRLMAKGLLTRWQAGQLLVGWTQLRLGNHRLCSQVGRSEYGRVFLAEHMQLRREVAIKTLSRRFTRHHDMVERFLEEARQVAVLDHRNLVHLLDIDSDNGQYFMVMEYIVGRDLQRMVEGVGPLAFITAVEYLAQAADGLTHAHAHGVIHRDVRPENLMVDEKETVKVLGLGVGYLAATGPFSQRPAHRRDIEHPADYRAPEQRSAGVPGDAASDIYSLGATAQFLLTGHPPRFVSEPTAESTEGATTPPTAQLLRLRPACPESLTAILARTLAVDPGQRFGSMLELQIALSEWLAQEGDVQCEPQVGLPPQPVRPLLTMPPPPPDKSPAPTNDPSPEIATAVDSFPQPTDGDGVHYPRHEGGLARRPAWRRRYVARGALATLAVFVLAAAYVWWPTTGMTITFHRAAQSLSDGKSPPAWPTKPPRILPPRRSAKDEAKVPPTTPTAQSTSVDRSATTEAADGGSAPATDAGAAPSGMSTGAKQVAPPEAAPATGVSGPAEANPMPDPTPAETSSAVPPSPSPAPTGAGTETSSSPSSPPSATVAKPFEHLPVAVDLPDAPAATLPATTSLAPLTAAGDVSLSLLGGDHAGTKGSRFVMQPEGTDSGAWRIDLVDIKGEQTSHRIAQLRLRDGQIQFGWEANLPGLQAESLRNCVVQLSRADERHDLRLRTPQKVAPLAVDLTRVEVAERWPLHAPPEASFTRFEIMQLPDPFPTAHTLDPATPVAADDQKVAVLFGEDPAEQVLLLELTPQLRNAFRLECRALFQVSPKLERFPLTAKKVDSATALVSALQMQKNVAAQQLRATLAQIPEGDPRRNQVNQSLQQADAELAETSQATGRLATLAELRQALAAGGLVHFRLFYLAGDCEVELLRSAIDAP